jgi:hypothetical protein
MVRTRVLARFALTFIVMLSLTVGLAWSADTQAAKATTAQKAKQAPTAANAAGEKTIAKAQVPAPVISAYNKAYPGNTPKTFTKTTKGGTVRYGIASTDKNGQAIRHAVYTSAGNMIEMDETITAADLPAAVQATITAQYPDQKILISQRITRDKATQYGVTVSGSDHLTHVILDANGTVIKTEAESHVGVPSTTSAPGSAPVAPGTAAQRNGKP